MLLVVDEVQSGMGRTGRMFAIEHADVRPDAIAIAKGIASGLPLGVALARAEHHGRVAAGRARQHVRRQPGRPARPRSRRLRCSGTAGGQRRRRRRAT